MGHAGEMPRYWLISGSTSFASLRSVQPAEVAGLERDQVGNALFRDRHLRADRNGLQRVGRFQLARQVRVVEPVRVDEPFARDAVLEFAAEGLAVAGLEVAKRHPVLATDLGLRFMHGAEKAVRGAANWPPRRVRETPDRPSRASRR